MMQYIDQALAPPAREGRTAATEEREAFLTVDSSDIANSKLLVLSFLVINDPLWMGQIGNRHRNGAAQVAENC